MIEAELAATAAQGSGEAPPEEIGRDRASAEAARQALLSRIGNEKTRAQIASLERIEVYDWASLFPKTDGLGAASDIKRRARMLKGVEPRLAHLLFPDERIEFVTSGALNSPLEQLTLGILWSLLINQTIFLITNYRLILLNSDSRGRAKVMMWQIPYHRLRKYRAGGLGGDIKLKLMGGKTYAFTGVPGRDRKRLKEVLGVKIEQASREGETFPCIEDRDCLCARCCSVLPPKARTCPECGETYIAPMRPALMSLLLPGLGDLYMGHAVVAILEMVAFALVLLAALVVMLVNWPLGILGAAAMVAGANALDAVVTYRLAAKGALPERFAWRGR